MKVDQLEMEVEHGENFWSDLSKYFFKFYCALRRAIQTSSNQVSFEAFLTGIFSPDQNSVVILLSKTNSMMHEVPFDTNGAVDL